MARWFLHHPRQQWLQRSQLSPLSERVRGPPGLEGARAGGVPLGPLGPSIHLAPGHFSGALERGSEAPPGPAPTDPLREGVRDGGQPCPQGSCRKTLSRALTPRAADPSLPNEVFVSPCSLHLPIPARRSSQMEGRDGSVSLHLLRLNTETFKSLYFSA